MKILTNYDFNQNQVLNMVIQKLATAPATAVSGQVYYNTSENRLFYYDGSAWKASDTLDAAMSGEDIISAINSSTATINDARLSAAVQDAISKSHSATHTISQVTDLQTALDGKVDDSQVMTNVPAGAVFTDTVTSINGKTGAIVKADIVALGIPAQDTMYTHPTGDGNLHVPATGTTNNGKVLTAGSTAGSTSWAVPTVTWANVSSKPTSTTSAIDTAVTDSHTHSNKTLLDTYTQTNANLADAVGKKHTQNTDTKTNSNTFQIGDTGVILKNSAGTALELRNSGDTGYADLRVSNLTVEGTTTTINSNEVNIGDNEIVLNSEITESSANSDGGIAIKRLMTDNTTRKDAKLIFDNSSGRWETVGGDVTGTLVTAQIANKVSATIGNGAATSFIIPHNFNTRDLVVMIRETSSPYAQVITDVEMTTVNSITVFFASAPASNAYTVTIIG